MHGNNTNTLRRRTQRTFALENVFISECQSTVSGNRAARRAVASVEATLVAERTQRLGTLTSLVQSHPRGSSERQIAQSIKRQFDCRPREPRRDDDGMTRQDRRSLDFMVSETSMSELGIIQKVHGIDLAYHKNTITLE